jgi:GcrA cell cycle regulator
MQSNDWPAEHSLALREYFMRGMSFAAIADAINTKFRTSYTRNAALGRAKRMGLEGPGRPADRSISPPAAESPEFEISARRTRRRRVSEFWRFPPAFEATEVKELRTADIVPRHLSLFDLRRGDCRYPYGGDTDGEAITFCGHPKRPGSSYCAAHFDLIVGPGTAAERSAERDLLRAVEAVEPRVRSAAWSIFFYPAV